MKWVRAKDSAICGVCKGIARSLDISVGLVRLFWILSVLFLGAGLWLYFILAISLPREDKIAEAREPYLLGVCSSIARRTELEVGVVRFLAICLGLLSFGATIVGYIVLYFVMDKPQRNSSTSPETPRFTV
jgi:phage shock protein PspC (stress-responsive transcriptional regulator)